MPKRTDIKKILLIGSGPIVIGQACEFDYSGTQACKALKEEGYKVVLINSNPATIMTDPDIADATYIEPLTADIIELIIKKERHDALLPTMGGQTALNLAVELAESTKKDIVRVIELAKVKPTEITLFIADEWKYEFYKNLKEKLEETREIGELMKSLMVKGHEEEVRKLIPRIVKTPQIIPETVLEQGMELEILKEEKIEYKNRFGADISVLRAEDSKEGKARQALPGKPAILLK